MARLRAGLAGVTSARVEFGVTGGSQTISASGVETLQDGKTTALDLTEQVGQAGSLRLVMVNDQVFVQLPPSLNKTGKPWVRATTSSSDPTIRQLAVTFQSAQQSASVSSSAELSSAAESVQLVGREPVAGQPADHYRLVIDTAKLAASQPGIQSLPPSGVKTIPVDMWLDRQNRPVKLTENFAVQGQAVSVNFRAGDYNQPVTITPPPADQVATT